MLIFEWDLTAGSARPGPRADDNDDSYAFDIRDPSSYADGIRRSAQMARHLWRPSVAPPTNHLGELLFAQRRAPRCRADGG